MATDAFDVQEYLKRNSWLFNNARGEPARLPPDEWGDVTFTNEPAKRPLKIVWSGVTAEWPTEAEAAAEIHGFDQGIESAALHVEQMGLKLIAREIRDLKRNANGSQE